MNLISERRENCRRKTPRMPSDEKGTERFGDTTFDEPTNYHIFNMNETLGPALCLCFVRVRIYISLFSRINDIETRATYC